MVRMQWRHQRFINRNLIYCVLVLLLIGLVYVLQQGSVRASSLVDWTAGPPILNSSNYTEVGSHKSNQPDCTYQKVATRSKYAGIISTGQLDGCVVRGKHVSLAHTSDGVYVSFGSDSYFYKFNTDNTGVLVNTIVLVPGGDRIGFVMSLSGQKSVKVYDNFSSRLTLDNDVLGYRMTNWADQLFPTGQASQSGVTINFSNNGRYAVYQNTDDWPGLLYRVDLETGEKGQFGLMHYGNYASLSLSPHYAISNDGNTVVGGGISDMTAWALDSNCVGEPFPPGSMEINSCPFRTISSGEYGEPQGDTWQGARTYGVELSDDATELSFLFELQNDGGFKRISLSPNGYTAPEPGLDYLALGDSYSSGEGDVERKADGGTYYLEGTDVAGDYENSIPDERCHISSRSYPFMLQQNGVVGGDSVRSVACSGAKRIDIQGWDLSINDEEGYLGQLVDRDGMHMPRLKDLSNLVSLQNEALHDYIPGRVQQVDIVEQSLPRIVSLTIGGNDLGFGEVLHACISKTAVYGVCDYATETGRKKAGSLIRNFRMQLVDTYTAVKKASPDTRLFVLGYPQFISSTDSFCGANSTLNRSDRELISESVTYLNQVIKSAAHQAGVYYIDIEDALGENILCTVVPDKYVNGLAAIVQDRSEPFHPNKKGHAVIADRIKDGLRGQTLVSFDRCESNSIITCPGYGSSASPALPEYFNPPSIEDRLIRAADMVMDAGNNVAKILDKGAEYVVRLSPYVAQPTSLFSISLESDPIDLGDFEVAADGSLEATIIIPSNVPAGYHTLYTSGKTYSGEEVTFRQIVRVDGIDSVDIDENNIPDSQQACGPFLVASEVDSDLDGVDDACDPQIAEKPELYRWRKGSADRTHNGHAEDENQVYIERNVWAGSITEVTGDYDPDGDGWSIVAISSNQFDGLNMGEIDSLISFEVLGDGSQSSPYYPVIYLRPHTQDCNAYRPASLSRVVAEESRILTIALISNEKCPQELPNSDPQEPDPPKNENLLTKLRNSLSAIKSKLISFVQSAVSQLRSYLQTLRH